jgi:hypothetical protein
MRSSSTAIAGTAPLRSLQQPQTAAFNTQGSDTWAAWQNLWGNATTYWQTLAERLQTTEQATLKGIEQDVALETTETLEARKPLDVFTLQWALAAQESTRLAQMAEQAYAALLEAQGHWWRDLEALGATLLRPWQGLTGPASASSAGALLAPPEDLTLSALIQTAGQAWPLTAEVYLNAITHDLQDTVPPADKR